jgi:hypothetical protein
MPQGARVLIGAVGNRRRLLRSGKTQLGREERGQINGDTDKDADVVAGLIQVVEIALAPDGVLLQVGVEPEDEVISRELRETFDIYAWNHGS